MRLPDAYIGETIGYIGISANTPGALAAQLQALTDAMRSAGFPEKVITYCLAQLMLESQWMGSHLSSYNNFGGIKYVGQNGATQGPKSPEGNYYAAYSNLDNFIADYKKVMSKSGTAGRPIDAATAQQFYNALHANHYFTDPNYSTKFNSVLKRVNASLINSHAQDAQFLQQYNAGKNTFTYDPKKGGITSNTGFDIDRELTTGKAWFAGLPTMGKIGVGAIAAYLVINIIKR